MKINLNRRKFLHVFLLVILVIILIFLSLNLSQAITASVIENPDSDYLTYTKAVCDERNYCEDYGVVCFDGNLVELNPTGFASQFSLDWVDSRSEETITKLC